MHIYSMYLESCTDRPKNICWILCTYRIKSECLQWIFPWLYPQANFTRQNISCFLWRQLFAEEKEYSINWWTLRPIVNNAQRTFNCCYKSRLINLHRLVILGLLISANSLYIGHHYDKFEFVTKIQYLFRLFFFEFTYELSCCDATFK